MNAAQPGLPNVNSALRDDPDLAQELKEAVCDALVNAVGGKASGAGEFGTVVLGQRPRDQFASGFLLNQMSPAGEDESSDIRIPVHGASLKLRRDADGRITVQPHLAVYVRVLPAWEDLDNDVLGLRPKPRLSAHVRQEVNAEAFTIAEAARVGGDTRSRKVIFAETARQLLMRRGVRFAGTVETIVAVDPEEEQILVPNRRFLARAGAPKKRRLAKRHRSRSPRRPTEPCTPTICALPKISR